MHIAAIHRFPVKGLGAESLQSACLIAGQALPGDRQYAIAHGASEHDAAKPHWLRKRNFLNISHCPALAALRSRADREAGTLSLWQEGSPEHSASLDDPALPADICTMLETLAGASHPGPYRLAALANGAFTDTERQAVSIASLRSLAELSEAAGMPIDPLRFRANIWVDGGEPWQERAWDGVLLQMGACRLRVLEQITRCAAIEASAAGVRDTELLATLTRRFGHVQFGVLAEVISDGEMQVGDTVRPCQSM